MRREGAGILWLAVLMFSPSSLSEILVFIIEHFAVSFLRNSAEFFEETSLFIFILLS
jgi:hypothetical protein